MRPYGGHLVAQALLLALEDAAPGQVPLTITTHFLAIGDSRVPVRYRRERLRSGRSFEHWVIDAAQDDVLLCRATVVLHRPEEGPVYGPRPRSSSNPDRSRVITYEPPEGTSTVLREGLEIRRASHWHPGDEGPPYQDAWLRCIEPLPSGMDEVVLAWCSDLELAPTVDLPFRGGWTHRMGASLEHSIRFHAPSFDASSWWLLEQEGTALSQGRGLATARAFTAAGELVATITQSTLLRLAFEG